MRFVAATIWIDAFVANGPHHPFNALSGVNENNKAPTFGKRENSSDNVGQNGLASGAVVRAADMEDSALEVRSTVLSFVHHCEIKAGQAPKMVRGFGYSCGSCHNLKRPRLGLASRRAFLCGNEAPQEEGYIASKYRFVGMCLIQHQKGKSFKEPSDSSGSDIPHEPSVANVWRHDQNFGTSKDRKAFVHRNTAINTSYSTFGETNCISKFLPSAELIRTKRLEWV